MRGLRREERREKKFEVGLEEEQRQQKEKIEKTQRILLHKLSKLLWFLHQVTYIKVVRVERLFAVVVAIRIDFAQVCLREEVESAK